jgi:hypothetical protein
LENPESISNWFGLNNVWGNIPVNFIDEALLIQAGLSGIISVDPGFIALDQNDFHLLPDSWCIDAGDPNITLPAGLTDIDGEGRIFGPRIDIGADENHGCVRPEAAAGPDQEVEYNTLVSLDGSASYFCDPNGNREFLWTQISGPSVMLNDPFSPTPTFVPHGNGRYAFELTVSQDGQESQPDSVVIDVCRNPPVAQAGPDQTYATLPSLVTLDGSASYSPEGDLLTYHWQQITGPHVELSDPNGIITEFVPLERAVYAFELTVYDTILNASTDIVGIVLDNHPPVAQAGSSRYATHKPVLLDGSQSYDADGYGELTYHWHQIGGPSVVLSDPNCAILSVSGFPSSSNIQKCRFELRVHDGILEGAPDTVDITIIPDFGTRSLRLMNESFDPNKPTLLAFGGGDCRTGSSLSFISPWADYFNMLTIDEYDIPYSIYGDVLLAYLSERAPDYNQMIQTAGFSTGGMPAIDTAIWINQTYKDKRFAVNRVSLLDGGCSDYTNRIKAFNQAALEDEPFWVDNYYATMGDRYDKALNICFPRDVSSHSTPVIWFDQSIQAQDPYHEGLTAGFFVSAAGEAKYLCLGDWDAYGFVWNPDTDTLEFLNEDLYPGRIPRPVTLLGPADGDPVDANGVILSCEPSASAIYYELLLGSNPQYMVYIMSRNLVPPAQKVDTFPFKTTYWTVRTTDAHGSTIFPEPRCIITDHVTELPITSPSNR